MVFAGRPLLFADSGIENINSAVDDTLFSARLERVLAQVDVAYSNSMIEAFWRSLKHQWLYLNSLDSIERLRVLVAVFIEQHNTQMPHLAFAGQTPDEIYFGTAVDLPAQLAAARSKAREERLADVTAGVTGGVTRLGEPEEISNDSIRLGQLILERETGLGPATLGLGSRCSTN